MKRTVLSDFDEFIQTLKRFRRTLFSLAGVSLVFPALNLMTQLGTFEDDKGFLVVSELVSSLVSCGAVILVYLQWSPHPEDEVEQVVAFRPQKRAGPIAFTFLLAALSIYGFYHFALSGSRWCLLFLSMGSFLFFIALANGLFALRLRDLQRKLWDIANPEERKALESYLKSIEKAENAIREAQKVRAEVEETIGALRKKLAWERRKRIIKGILSAVYEVWLKARLRIGGQKLLTMSEQLDQLRKKAAAEEFMRVHRRQKYGEAFNKIVSGQVHSMLLEGTHTEIYQVESARYVIVDETLDMEKAQQLLHDLQKLADPETRKIGWIAVLAKPAVSVTYDAKQVLERAGVDFYQPNPDRSVKEGG